MDTDDTTPTEPSIEEWMARQEIPCKHLVGKECWVTAIPTYPSPEICRACTKLGRGINQITVLQTIKTLQDAGEPVPHYLTDFITKTREGHHTQDILGSGPGTVLKNMFSWFITKPPNCSCDDRAELMNLWGVDGCNENFRTILGWLRESALDNNYPYNEIVVSSLVRLAINISSRKVIV